MAIPCTDRHKLTFRYAKVAVVVLPRNNIVWPVQLCLLLPVSMQLLHGSIGVRYWL